MQGVYFNDRNIQFFLRRKHKLHKALALPADHPPSSPQDQHHILQLYLSLLNRDNQISQLDYFIKHEFHCSLPSCIDKVLQIVWELLAVRSGTLLAFVIPSSYRLFIGFAESTPLSIGTCTNSPRYASWRKLLANYKKRSF